MTNNNVEKIVRLTVLMPEDIHDQIEKLASEPTRDRPAISKSKMALHLIQLGLGWTMSRKK